MNLHADGWESDDGVLLRNRERYKESQKENKQLKKELIKKDNEIEKLKQENAKGIKFSWQNFLYYFIKMNWNVDDNFTITNIYTKCEKKLQVLYPNSNTIQASIQGNIQKLRDNGCIEFIDNRGHYKRNY